MPYPYAVDDHQTSNGKYLVDAKASLMFQEADLTADQLAEQLSNLFTQHERLLAMAVAARQLGHADAAEIIATACEEVAIC